MSKTFNPDERKEFVLNLCHMINDHLSQQKICAYEAALCISLTCANMMAFVLADDGMGLSNKVKEECFDRFFEVLAKHDIIKIENISACKDSTKH